jgi:hypothetical protein
MKSGTNVILMLAQWSLYIEISGITPEFTISDLYLQDYRAIEIYDLIKQKKVI